jgi:hypothetical protein
MHNGLTERAELAGVVLSAAEIEGAWSSHLPTILTFYLALCTTWLFGTSYPTGGKNGASPYVPFQRHFYIDLYCI